MVLIPAGIMSVSLLRKNEPFFNIHEIVQEYRKLIRGSTIVFFILPLLFSVGLALLYTAGTRFYSEIGVILGIILSMLWRHSAFCAITIFQKSGMSSSERKAGTS